MPDNQPVRVKYIARWSILPKLNHRVDHFEFFGNITDTGYRSHFTMVDPNYNPDKKEIIAYIKKVIEEVTGLRYGKPAQMKLI